MGCWGVGEGIGDRMMCWVWGCAAGVRVRNIGEGCSVLCCG